MLKSGNNGRQKDTFSEISPVKLLRIPRPFEFFSPGKNLFNQLCSQLFGTKVAEKGAGVSRPFSLFSTPEK